MLCYQCQCYFWTTSPPLSRARPASGRGSPRLLRALQKNQTSRSLGCTLYFRDGSKRDAQWKGRSRIADIDECVMMASPDGGGACVERVEDRPHLHMRPCPAARRADVALVELGRNGVVARCPGPHDLLNDRADIGRKPPRIRLHGSHAALGYLGHVGIA
jgi:hypothetical protein